MMQVKWLDRLRVETAEATSFCYATKYRVPLSPVQPGEAFGFTFENSRPPWLLQLTSFIVDPVADSTMTAGPVTVGGFAFNDGAARLESVEVSVEPGRVVAIGHVGRPDSPPRVGAVVDRGGPWVRCA